MHILGAKGGVAMLLRGIDDEQENVGQWQLYLEQSGAGETPYQDFDRKISDRAIRWLREESRGRDRPWVLHVSYVSPHPPFLVPQRLLDLFPLERIPLPPLAAPEARPEHPALQHLRRVMAWGDLRPEDLRRIGAGYLALIAHLDEEIGRVMAALEDLGLLETTRVLYTSDHGEMAGSHGLLGKCNLYEGAIGVPLLIAGPGVPAGRVVAENASHVDLFPTLVEGAGGQLLDQDTDLPGTSLWPAITGGKRARRVFAEYHAAGSRTGSFMVRDGHMKLIYHVNMSSQLFDLAVDPEEIHDLAREPAQRETLARMEVLLRAICDPEDVDRRAKADQRAKMDHWGGPEAIKAEGMLVYTPPPGAAPHIQGRAGAP
jgi:arylsulfatase A-like enzyme